MLLPSEHVHPSNQVLSPLYISPLDLSPLFSLLILLSALQTISQQSVILERDSQRQIRSDFE